MGTSIIPNLDSIAEFRIVTNNFDAEYGNYSGGQINAITKSGTNDYHGDVFEFLRNTDLDARNFYSPGKGKYIQNQFGGIFGGRIIRDKLFFFVDYQGTRQIQGQSTGNVLVPSAADRQATSPTWRAAHGYCDRRLLGEPAIPEARLHGKRRRTVLCARVHAEHDLRFSECRRSPVGDHDALAEPAQVHPLSELRTVLLNLLSQPDVER